MFSFYNKYFFSIKYTCLCKNTIKFVPCLREDENFLKKYSASRGTHGRG